MFSICLFLFPSSWSWSFHKHKTLAIMPILASEALLYENKKIQWKMLPPVGIEPRPLITSDSKSSTLLSTLTCYVLLRRSLNFCSCITWFLDFDDSVKINRAWLYEEPKVSTNVNLVQKGECWTWDHRLWETFFTGLFCFHIVKPLIPLLALLLTN